MTNMKTASGKDKKSKREVCSLLIVPTLLCFVRSLAGLNEQRNKETNKQTCVLSDFPTKSIKGSLIIRLCFFCSFDILLCFILETVLCFWGRVGW